MKKILKIIIFFLPATGFMSCEKKDYPAGLPEYEHHYYLVHVPNNNTTKISVTKTQTALVKLPVQFYSTFSRSYDAIGNYSIVTTGIAAPALIGRDFEIVDKNGVVQAPAAEKFSMVFPKAEEVKDTIYIKLLNNPTPGTRSFEVHIVENKTDAFYVDIFSTAFRKTVEIK